MDKREPRIRKAKRPSIEELCQFFELPHEKFPPLIARLFLVPENSSRQAYTVLRGIYLAAADDWWNMFLNLGQHISKEHLAKFKDSLDKKEEIELWFRPPLPPLSLEESAKLIEGSKSEFWRHLS